MARVLADLEKDISALSKADKEKLLDFVMGLRLFWVRGGEAPARQIFA